MIDFAQIQTQLNDLFTNCKDGDRKSVLTVAVSIFILFVTIYAMCLKMKSSLQNKETAKEEESDSEKESEGEMGIIKESDGRRISARLKAKREKQERAARSRAVGA